MLTGLEGSPDRSKLYQNIKHFHLPTGSEMTMQFVFGFLGFSPSFDVLPYRLTVGEF